MKKQIFKQAVALSLAVGVLAPSASALSWKDGALANYRFTYAGDNGGIESVEVSDTNDTFKGEIALGQTITTQTGTIVWRDSYTNTTTFTVTTKPGYELVGLSGANVEENDFSAIGENTYSFSFTDKGAEAWCYGKDVSFDLMTDKIDYTVNFYVDGELVGSSSESTVNDLLALPEEPAKEGYTFDGWYVDGQKLTDNTLTEDLIALADENNTIDITGRFQINTYNVRINYYADNMLGECNMLDTHYNYGETPSIDSGYKLVGGGEIAPITGDTTLNLVKYTPVEEDDWSYQYGFLYNSKDAGVECVEYSIDGSGWTGIDVNEGVKFETDNLPHEEFYNCTITFKVKVADGMKLVLNSNGGNTVSEENGYYIFKFTRTANQGLPGAKNVPNVSFDLTTINK